MRKLKILFNYLCPPIFYNLLKFGSIKSKPIKTVFVSPKLSSYSQYQEDLVLDCIFKSKKEGVYIDVGANDPERFSNTKRFYDRGWSGINIEPTPYLYDSFCKNRVRDINLNIGIGNENNELTFYELEANTLSTFSKIDALENCKIYNSKIIKEYNVKIKTLKDIFGQYLLKESIDFLTVDTEGYDLDVLKSNDWVNYRPHVIVIELNKNENEIAEYLLSQSYTLIYNNNTNGIFIDEKCILN